MKVILENFGPIRRVEFDLTKDLNVIFGKNNIGKSYAITALYIILKHLLAEFGGDFAKHLFELNRRQKLPPNFSNSAFTIDEMPSSILEEAIQKLRNAFQNDINLSNIDLAGLLEPALCDVLNRALEDGLTNSFNNSFESIDALTSNQQSLFSLVVELNQINLCFGISKSRVILNKCLFTQSITAQVGQESSVKAERKGATTLYLTRDSILDDSSSLVAAIWTVLHVVIDNIQHQLLSIAKGLYFMPASRSGLYQALSNMGSLFAELAKNRSLSTASISVPSISEPVADYFLLLSSIKTHANEGEVSSIAHQMERELLGGEVIFNEQNNKLYFIQDVREQKVSMDLSFASSMIAEIAPIVAYLKYVLRYETKAEFIDHDNGKPRFRQVRTFPPSLLFIEEPEAHLHPEVQVKLMEFFARLTKHNVKVIMTSHSNYMFNKLSNLLLTDELAPEKVGSYLMRATPEGSVMDDFAMRAEEEGIADENFVDVAEQLYNERLAAYDKLNANE